MARNRKKRIKQMRERQLGQIYTFAQNAVRANVNKRMGVTSLMANYNLSRKDAKKIWAIAERFVAKEQESKE